MQILLAINGETCHVIRKPLFFFQDANCDGRLVKKDDREIFFFFFLVVKLSFFTITIMINFQYKYYLLINLG
jgi:hypothetical protein